MTVTLVGAGPGEKGLLTLKGAKRIEEAGVVLFDRFVGEEILAMIPDGAEKIDVGKNAGSHPVPQDRINLLLLEKAKEGLNVVRLKGGDPFVFGRGGEELELLAENDIPFEVVPGVTTAIAGAAYAGIPVTHRDYASSMHIITGHAKNDEKPCIDYEALVRAKGTLVFMMGVSALEEICAGCIAAGMDREMPAAIVENATKSCQRKFVGTLGALPKTARENHVESPAVIIIGEVCRLSGRFDWFSRKPLLGKRIIVARAKPGPSKLSDRLRELGCHVIEQPCANIVPLTAPGCDLEKALERINNYSWLVFTSGVGVNIFFDCLIKSSFDIRALSHLKIACVGTETEKEINKRGIIADYRPPVYNGAALAQGLSEIVKNGERLLIARAKEGAEDLTRILKDAGIDFDDVAIYAVIANEVKQSSPRNDGPDDMTNEVKQSILRKDVTAVVANEVKKSNPRDDETGLILQPGEAYFAAFTSSSAVDWFAESAGGVDFSRIKAVCIGNRTAKTARSYGMEVYVSEEATIESMVKKIEEVCT